VPTVLLKDKQKVKQVVLSVVGLVILEQWAVLLNGGYIRAVSACVLGYGMFIANWYSSLMAINSIQISQKVMCLRTN
jgi:capsular polysaccharide biosynthesis protein